MKSFSQYIAEAFDKPYKYDMRKVTYDYYLATFTTDDGDSITVRFDEEVLGDVDYDWHTEDSWEISFQRNGSQELTGEGDAIRIFATVMAATREFIKRENPERIHIGTLKSVGREKLYLRMLKKYLKGYEINIERSGGATDITMVKK